MSTDSTPAGQGVFPARSLDKAGRCCGRKPLHYKTRSGLKSIADPHYFCARCCAEYTMDGKQRQNWAWRECDGSFFAAYPDSEAAHLVRSALQLPAHEARHHG